LRLAGERNWRSGGGLSNSHLEGAAVGDPPGRPDTGLREPEPLTGLRAWRAAKAGRPTRLAGRRGWQAEAASMAGPRG